MANELTFIEKAEQKGSTFSNERKCANRENKLSEGNIVFKKDTGMAFTIGKISLVNGIKHYQLTCAQTSSPYFLSKFSLENDYTVDSVKVENIGLKMVKRLSKMWSK